MFLFRRGPGRLTAEQARTSDGAPVRLDVRGRPDGKAGHAPGAVHPPLPRLLAGAEPPPRAQGRPAVMIRRSRPRSRQATGLLARRGIDAVDVTGGMAARTQAGPPVAGEREQGGHPA